MTEYYVTTAGRGYALHTDPECSVLERSKGVREARQSEIERYDECRHCTAEMDRYTGGQKSHYQSLREAASDAD